MIAINLHPLPKTRNSRQRAVSAATIYRMQGDLKQLLNNNRSSLPLPQYQAMYAKLINLNNKETQFLHTFLEDGKTKSIFSFLKDKCANIHWKV